MGALDLKKRILSGQQINAVKLDIKSRLAAAASAEDKVKICLSELGNLDDSSSRMDLVSVSVLGISALLHMSNGEAQDEKLARKLIETVESALRLLGVKIEHPVGGVLWRDLRAAESLVYRTWGLHWRSMWTLASSQAQEVQTETPSYGMSFNHGMALRCLRLGSGPLAHTYLDRALEQVEDDRKRFELELLRIHLYRMTGDVQKSIDACADLLSPALDETMQATVAWELICAKMQIGGKVSELLEYVKPSAPTNSPRNFVEAFFWSRIRGQIAGFPKLASRARNSGTRAQDAGLFYRAALVIEKFQDPHLTIDAKLEQLQWVLARKDQLRSMDMELLLLAAATSELMTVAPDLASIVHDQYESLSMQLSNYRSRDILGIRFEKRVL
jgi:hypothetical protein